MEIRHLPQDIYPPGKYLDEHLTFYNYTADVNSLKGRSILHTNAISLVISGEKTMHFADKAVHITDDEFHFLSTGNCLASVHLSEKQIFRSILIFFDNKALTDFHVKYASLINSAKTKEKVMAERYIAFKKDAFAHNYIRSLDILLASGEELSAERKLLKFEELLLHLLETAPKVILSFQPSQNESIDNYRIRKAVETNIPNNLSLEELAFLCNMSISTFKRKFTKIYGTTPNKWFLQKKMEMASILLRHYDEKPSEIYHKIGYENHSSFTESFKKTYGLTPKEFQQQQMTFDQ